MYYSLFIPLSSLLCSDQILRLVLFLWSLKWNPKSLESVQFFLNSISITLCLEECQLISSVNNELQQIIQPIISELDCSLFSYSSISGSLSWWMKVKPKIWSTFDEPYSSSHAKASFDQTFYILINLFINCIKIVRRQGIIQSKLNAAKEKKQL